MRCPNAANDFTAPSFRARLAGAISPSVSPHATQGAACKVLVAAWTRDAEAHPGTSRFVCAYTNRDVDALNAELRNVRRRRGELTGADVRFETRHGPAGFAVGDRGQFTDKDRKLHIYNGNAGTITAIDERTGQITIVFLAMPICSRTLL
jgi:ATP-dependent exoDNAse (exonuclease V) alpha subunit